MEGRFAAAEQLADEASELASTLSGVDASGVYGVQMFSLRREQGRLDEIRPVVEAVARLDRSEAAWRPGLAAVYAELGLLDEARAEVKLLVTPGLPLVPRDALYLAAMTYLADAVAIVGDRSAAVDAVRRARTVRRNGRRRRPCHRVLRRGRSLPRCARRDGGALARRRTSLREGHRARRFGRRADLARAQSFSLRELPCPARPPRRPSTRAMRCCGRCVDTASAIGMPSLERRVTELIAELAPQLDNEGSSGAAGTERRRARRRAHRARAGDPRLSRRRAQQRRDRARAAHQREHGRQPRPRDPAEDRLRQSHRSRDVGGTEGRRPELGMRAGDRRSGTGGQLAVRGRDLDHGVRRHVRRAGRLPGSDRRSAPRRGSTSSSCRR